MPTEIDAAIANLYSVFRFYRRVSPDAIRGIEYSAPADVLNRIQLERLPAEAFAWYVGHAVTSCGTESDFKHFLPRLLELTWLETSRQSTGDMYSVCYKLGYSEWMDWPCHEYEAVHAFFIAAWRHLVIHFPVSQYCSDPFSVRMQTENWILRYMPYVYASLQPFLAVWNECLKNPSTRSAAVGVFAIMVNQYAPELIRHKCLRCLTEKRTDVQEDEIVRWLVSEEPRTALEAELVETEIEPVLLKEALENAYESLEPIRFALRERLQRTR